MNPLKLTVDINNKTMPKSGDNTHEMDKLYSDSRVFKIRTHEELRRARRYSAFVSLLSMDLSRIDPDGDIENYSGFDEFIKSLKQIIRNSIRDTDIIGSSSNRRLLLLLIDTPLDGAEALSERLQKTISYFMCNNVKSPISWRVPIRQYCFPEVPGKEPNLQSILEIIAKDSDNGD